MWFFNFFFLVVSEVRCSFVEYFVYLLFVVLGFFLFKSGFSC